MTDPAAPIRVLVVDDQALVREGLSLIAGSDPGIEVVGTADDGRAGLEAALRLRPDVVLMDVRMPGMDGIEATAKLLARPAEAAEIRVLALTTYDSEDFAVRMLAAGASGFLLKDAPGEELVRAIRTVHLGDAVLDPRMTRQLVDRLTAGGRTAPIDEQRAAALDAQLASLTERERDVLEHLVRGASNARIAAALHLAEVTVKAHVGRILDKLDVPDRIHVVIWAYESGHLRPGE
ncbi:MAG: response regulator transcription factor [Microbacteriaceae bacterium]|nr:response regulator transcription factor [Microbacteriaceae bacterium]